MTSLALKIDYEKVAYPWQYHLTGFERQDPAVASGGESPESAG